MEQSRQILVEHIYLEEQSHIYEFLFSEHLAYFQPHSSMAARRLILLENMQSFLPKEPEI